MRPPTRLLAATSLLAAALLYAGDKPRVTAEFTRDGKLVRPVEYRQWVFLSSGLGMTYGPNAPAAGSPLRFDNVYVNPPAYQAFLRTGKWPDGTVLLLEVRASESNGSINKHGHFQSSLVALEANVKDSRRFQGNGWSFFDFAIKEGTLADSAARIPAGNRCEQCHSKNGAVDNTFVQFYPELIPVARQFKTLRTSAE